MFQKLFVVDHPPVETQDHVSRALVLAATPAAAVRQLKARVTELNHEAYAHGRVTLTFVPDRAKVVLLADRPLTTPAGVTHGVILIEPGRAGSLSTPGRAPARIG